MKLGFDTKADPIKNDPPYKPVDPSRPIKKRLVGLIGSTSTRVTDPA